MTDDKKVVKLTKVTGSKEVENNYPTYLELLTDHVTKLEDRRRSLRPVVMVITCLTEDGNIQEVLYGDCVAQVIGLLEITKQNVYLDSMGIME